LQLGLDNINDLAMTTYDQDALFHAAHIELLIPSHSDCPAHPEDPSSSSWWTDAQKAKSRDVAFLGRSPDISSYMLLIE
jgi:hypothetical protein